MSHAAPDKSRTTPAPTRRESSGSPRRRLSRPNMQAPYGSVKFLRPTPATSRRMARVRRSATTPELAVRSALTERGIRFRVSNYDLPGSPDVANRNARWAIFVHGCFWHRHQGCRRATTPSRNAEYWQQKFLTNVRRDARAQRRLRQAGWTVFVVWECAADRSGRRIAARIARLSGAKATR